MITSVVTFTDYIFDDILMITGHYAENRQER